MVDQAREGGEKVVRGTQKLATLAIVGSGGSTDLYRPLRADCQTLQKYSKNYSKANWIKVSSQRVATGKLEKNAYD